jgi:hypothetical protein
VYSDLNQRQRNQPRGPCIPQIIEYMHTNLGFLRNAVGTRENQTTNEYLQSWHNVCRISTLIHDQRVVLKFLNLLSVENSRCHNNVISCTRISGKIIFSYTFFLSGHNLEAAINQLLFITHHHRFYSITSNLSVTLKTNFGSCLIICIYALNDTNSMLLILPVGNFPHTSLAYLTHIFKPTCHSTVSTFSRCVLLKLLSYKLCGISIFAPCWICITMDESYEPILIDDQWHALFHSCLESLPRYCGWRVLQLYSALVSFLSRIPAKVLWMEGFSIVLLTILRPSSCPCVLCMSGECDVRADGNT